MSLLLRGTDEGAHENMGDLSSLLGESAWTRGRPDVPMDLSAAVTRSALWVQEVTFPQSAIAPAGRSPHQTRMDQTETRSGRYTSCEHWCRLRSPIDGKPYLVVDACNARCVAKLRGLGTSDAIRRMSPPNSAVRHSVGRTSLDEVPRPFARSDRTARCDRLPKC